MFHPLTEAQMKKALTGDTLEGTTMGAMSMPYTLAVFACGGQSLRTDKVAQVIGKRLPGFLAGIVREVSRECKEFVCVKFDGNSTLYHYKLAPEDHAKVEVGDRVVVYSSATHRVEFVRVVGFGRGEYTGVITKYARALPQPIVRHPASAAPGEGWGS